MPAWLSLLNNNRLRNYGSPKKCMFLNVAVKRNLFAMLLRACMCASLVLQNGIATDRCYVTNYVFSFLSDYPMFINYFISHSLFFATSLCPSFLLAICHKYEIIDDTNVCISLCDVCSCHRIGYCGMYVKSIYLLTR